MTDYSFEATANSFNAPAGKIHYNEAGSGPALLLLHGSGPGVTGWENFSDTLASFAGEYRCIVPDFPGYGKSDSVDGNPIEVCVQSLIALMDGLGIEKAHIIGNSLGGIVGGLFAAYNPNKVDKFVSIGGLGINIFSSFPAEGLVRLSQFAENPTREHIVAWLNSMVYDRAIVTDELIDRRMQQATESKTLETTRVLYSQASLDNMQQMFSGPDATQRLAHLSSITAPTLLTWGREDRVSPIDMALLPMKLIPNCELHVFPQCGHWAMIERKQEFESVVRAFLAR